jgi:peptidyl-prolyl cis-trans isomerase B (cyclophilin B)
MKQTKIFILVLILVLIILLFFVYLNKTTNIKEKERYPTMIIIETTLGDITVELFDKNAPITVNNFKQYIESEFYNNTVFHRVIKDFMIQGGGFLENGSQKDTSPPIVLESTNKTGLSNLKGTLAMARTMDPNSATSQFFINTNDNLFLNYQNQENPGYAVFGKVVSGMDIVLKIENMKTTTKHTHHQDWPEEEVVIKRIYIKE